MKWKQENSPRQLRSHPHCGRQREASRPAKRRFPNTVDEPRNIGYYLKPLLDITKRPDRDEILKTYLKETYV